MIEQENTNMQEQASATIPDNRYNLVKNVAQRAKKILEQNVQKGLQSEEISNNRAITDAIEELDNK